MICRKNGSLLKCLTRVGPRNKWDISIPVGVSYQVPTIPIVIDGRLNLGLTDIFKKDVLESGQKNCQNVVFQLTVGYKFKL